MKKFFIITLLYFLLTNLSNAQQDSIGFYCSFSGEDTTITDGPTSTPLTGSTNMAIILCV
jgi:hypothetical protein